MISWSGRAILALLLAPVLVLAGALPPEHVHEADADHDHPAIHRHLQLHDTDAEHGHSSVGDEDARVVWMDTPALVQSSAHGDAPVSATGVVLAARARPDRSWVAGLDFGAPPAHGPPRAHVSPRAPPSLPA